MRFLQIGANDGINADPAHRFIMSGLWQGHLVEPLPGAFEVLKTTYGDVKGLNFHNVAIALENGFQTFYRVRDPNSALSSFDKNIILKHVHWLPDIEFFIDEIVVPTHTIRSLYGESGEGELDVVITDTEGFDDRVIELLNVHATRPKAVLFEHCHLT